MLKSKDRGKLRALANKMPAILHVGKESITPEFAQGVREALAARELVKINVLNNCDLTTAEAAEILSSRTGSSVVQIIGRKFVLYKKSSKKEGVL